jgi:hypothetical protein
MGHLQTQLIFVVYPATISEKFSFMRPSLLRGVSVSLLLRVSVGSGKPELFCKCLHIHGG